MFNPIQRDPRVRILLDNLDTVAGIGGIIAGFIITSLYLVSETIHLLMLGPTLALASLFYLVLKNKREAFHVPTAGSRIKIIDVVFFIFLTLSFWILQIGEGRPLLYFIIISITVGFLALSIANIHSKFDTILQILKIFLVSLNLKYSIFYYYGGSGVDYWVHLRMNNALAFDGFIQTLVGKEFSFPIMHIQVAIHQIITNFPIKDASNFAIIIPLVISSICVFFIARRFFNAQIGLIALLFVNISDYFLYWGSVPQTTTFGACLFFFIVFALFRSESIEKSRMSWLIVILILLLTMVLTHAVSSFILLTTLVGLYAGSYVYREFFDDSATLIPRIGLLLVLGVFLIQHWFEAGYSESSQQSFFNVILSTLDDSLTNNAELLNRPETVAAYAASLPPLIERVANTTGIALLMLLAAIGALMWLGTKNRNRFTFSMLFCTVTLLVITFAFPLFGIRNIEANRWFVFMYFFLGLMAACGVFFLLGKIPRMSIRTSVLLLTVVGLTFFMTTSTVSNLDSPIWLKKSTISTSYTFQEVIGAGTLTRISPSAFSDSYYCVSVLNKYYGNQAAPLHSTDLSGREGDLFIWRNYTQDRPIRLFATVEGYYKPIETQVVVGQKLITSLERKQKIYSNDDMSGYLIL